MKITIPVSVAELFDKISILQIKKENIQENSSLRFVNKELDSLIEIVKRKNMKSFMNHDLYNELKLSNKVLWNICEERRLSEKNKLFDESFINQSRLEYKTNDKRAKIKFKINKYYESEIIEVKSYVENE